MFLEIFFNSEITTKIQIPRCKKISKKESNINFNFYQKTVGSKKAVFLGFARVGLAEILSCGYSFLKKCPVRDENGLMMGIAVLKLELGSKGIHFGSDFIGESFKLTL